MIYATIPFNWFISALPIKDLFLIPSVHLTFICPSVSNDLCPCHIPILSKLGIKKLGMLTNLAMAEYWYKF